jgi:GTPase SAR1 family protein
VIGVNIMALTGAEVALGKAVFDITVKAVPWTNIAQRYHSYNLMIIGQERSGKTTFYGFLSRHQLGYRDENTKPTVGHDDSGCLIFEWRTQLGGNLSCAFRNIGDYSGQTEPARIARAIVNKKPHLIIIVLDITKRDLHAGIHGSYMNWLDNMCSHLKDTLNRKPMAKRTVSRKLRQVVILLNKTDCLNPGDRDEIVREAEENIKRILSERLRGVIPDQKLDYFKIRPCSIVRDPLNGEIGDTISRLERIMADIATSIPRPD